MIRLTGRRTGLVAAIVCAGLGTGGLAAVQAGASGGPAGAISHTTHPKPIPVPPARHLPGGGVAAPAVAATNAICGHTITASLTLNGDLSCSGNGLIVSGAGVVLNLNGHQITGDPNSGSLGVQLTGASETVTNGVVSHFDYGVFVTGTGDTVSTVRSTYNHAHGINDHGQSTKLTNDVVYGNNVDGIYSLAGTAIYSGDHELNNAGFGLELAGSGHGVTISGNVANGNGFYGIYDGDQGTTLKSNTGNYNAYDGIYVNENSVIDGGGNIAKGNDYGSGATPEQCYGVVCS